jgi:carboxylesterase
LCIGANLALLLAAQFKNQISQLFLLSTTLYYDGWALPWYKFLIPLVYYTPIGRLYSYRERDPFGVKNQKMRRLIAHQMTQKYVSDAGAARLQSHGLYQVHRMIRQIKKVLPQIQTPVTIFHSTEDDMTSLRSADYLYKHIGSNHKSTVLLHDSYHMITLDNDRDKVANHIIMLLAINCPTKAKITLVA